MSGQGNIGVTVSARMVMDTSQAENATKSFAQQMQNAKFVGPIDPSQTPPLIGGDNVFQASEKLQGVNEKLAKQKDSIDKVIESLSEFNDMLQKVTKGQNNPVIPGLKNPNLPVPTDGNSNESSILNHLLKFERDLPNFVGGMANGNVMGVGSSLISNGLGGLTKLATVLSGPVGIGIAAVSGLIAGGVKLATESEKKYEEALPSMDKVLAAYGYNYNSLASNNAESMVLRNIVTKYAENTGLTNNEFMTRTADFGQYGVENGMLAAQMTQNAAKYARFTNGDISSIQGFMGLAMRYGGSKDANGDLDYAYGAAMASGMSRNQFPEFLQSIERVIEESVSKGYAKSTKEVADTLVMFDKLSGGSDFWKGEQGANRLMQINNGLASATSLSSTGQLIAYQALRGNGTRENLGAGTYVNGGDWINDLIFMEQGLNPGNFRNISNQLKNTYGNDVQSQIMAWKEISGLNYTGAAQLYNMSLSGVSEAEIEAKIKSLQTDPTMVSDSTRLQNSLNNIESSLVNIGQHVFNVKMVGLETIESLLGVIAGDSLVKSMKTLVNTTGLNEMHLNGLSGNHEDFSSTFAPLMEKAVANGDYANAMELLNLIGEFGSLSDEDKKVFDWKDFDTKINGNDIESVNKTFRTQLNQYKSYPKTYATEYYLAMEKENIGSGTLNGAGYMDYIGQAGSFFSNPTWRNADSASIGALVKLMNDNQHNSAFVTAANKAFEDEFAAHGSDSNFDMWTEMLRVLVEIQANTKLTESNTRIMEVVTNSSGNTFSSPML